VKGGSKTQEKSSPRKIFRIFFVNGVEDVMTTVITLFEDKKYRTLKLK